MALAIPTAAVAVLAAEVVIARRGERLPDVGPLAYESTGSTTAVWIGDSTAVGIGIDDGADAVASVVARERGERVVMLARSGATVADVVRVQLPNVAAAAPDRVYVSVGANDVTHLTATGEFRRDYRELLAGLPDGVPVTVLGVPDMGSPPRFLQPLRAVAGFRGRRLDDVIGAVVDAGPRRSDVLHVDIEGRTGPAFRRNPGRYFSADDFHPSADGYRLWAEAVLSTFGL